MTYVGDQAVLEAQVENGVDLALRSGKHMEVDAKLVSQRNEIRDSNENSFVDGNSKERLDLLEVGILIATSDVKSGKQSRLDEEEIGNVGNETILQA